MKFNRFSALFSVIAVVVLSVAAFGQTETFSDPDVEYTFEVPNKSWKQTAQPSVTSPNVEYTNGDRSAGYLEIRKITVRADSLTSEAIGDEEEKLKFLQGYVAGKEEIFRGKLDGNVFNYEFIRSGRNMAGRYYFLRANPTTVYLLRFTAQKEKLLSVRTQADVFARTFAVKTAK